MKPYFLFLLLLLGSYGCTKNDSSLGPDIDGTLVSPRISAKEYNTSFTGALMIYPCNTGTSIYYGNYSGVPIKNRTQPATYLIGKSGYLLSAPELQLPIGQYSLVYWGVPYDPNPAFEAPGINEPQVALGGNLMNEHIMMQPYDYMPNVYKPVYDYVHGIKDVSVGSEEIDISLIRVVSGINVLVQNQDGTPLDNSILSIFASVDGVAESMNFYTGRPENLTKTMGFALTIADNRMIAGNHTVFSFPSVSNPTFRLQLLLDNGQTKVFTTKLQYNLSANNKTTVVVNLNAIVVSPEQGMGFEVSKWSETVEVIDTDIIS